MTTLPRYLQLLWGKDSAGRRGPKPGRSIEEIGAAAVRIADEQGLDAVSMKSVAEAVGFTTMSLYRYVDSKAELEAVMLDVALGAPGLDYGRKGWRSRITMWASEIANRRLAHSWSVEIVATTPPLTPNVIAWMEAGLAALDGTPLTSGQRLSAMLAIDGWAHNHVRQSIQIGLVGRGPGEGDEVGSASYEQAIAELVDPRRFPHLASGGLDLDDDRDDFFVDEFRRGLGLFLDGLEALILRAQSG